MTDITDPTQQCAENNSYQPTEHEQELLKKCKDQQRAKPPIRMKVVGRDENHCIVPDHPNEEIGDLLLMDALGIDDRDFFKSVMMQIASACLAHDKLDVNQVNAMLSMMRGIKPGNQKEVVLALQMATVHQKMMTLLNVLSNSRNREELDCVGQLLNELTKIYNSQMECLNRCRANDELAAMYEPSFGESAETVIILGSAEPTLESDGSAQLLAITSQNHNL